MGGFNLTINGVNTNASNLIKIDKNVQQKQATEAATDNGLDEIMVYDEANGEAYMAYGQGMNFGGLDGYQDGNRVLATLNGKQVAIVPFVKEGGNGEVIKPLFDDEVNTAGDGTGLAWTVTKNVGGKVLGFAKDNALEIAGAGMTLGTFARLGGAKVASTAGQSFWSKAGTWAFGPAKELTGQAGKGALQAGKWVAIGAGAAAILGTAGAAGYGALRKGDASKIGALGTKVN